MSDEVFTHFLIHILFEFMAVCAALLAGVAIYRWRLSHAIEVTASKVGVGYFAWLSLGCIVGAYFFGTLNLYISGIPSVGKSIIGSIFGAICGVEIYKFLFGIKESTGYIYAIPFSVCVAIGRIGCLLSGLDDHTYGKPTEATWGWDFDDHILRYPVQLYESVSMGIWAIALVVLLKFNPSFFARYAFYLTVGFYALQRFFWEFLKPYGIAFASLNVFQYICIVLIVYAITMCIFAKRRE